MEAVQCAFLLLCLNIALNSADTGRYFYLPIYLSIEMMAKH